MEEKEIKKIKGRIKIFFVVFLAATVFLQAWKLYWPEASIEIKGERFEVLFARNLYQQRKGLGGRAGLDGHEGMLFVFSFSDKHGIVMRGMKFPIDIVWVNNTEVVDIAQNIQPEPEATEDELMRYYPRTDANVILEFPASWVARHDLKIGERVLVYE